MAKKSTPNTAASKTIAAPDAGIKATVARNSPLPKAEPMSRSISQEMIAKRAYEIFVSGSGGSQDDNWHRAEQELRGL